MRYAVTLKAYLLSSAVKLRDQHRAEGRPCFLSHDCLGEYMLIFDKQSDAEWFEYQWATNQLKVGDK